MNLAHDNPEITARALIANRDRGLPVDIPAAHRSVPDLGTAYRIQQSVEGLLGARSGEKVIGYKIAATNAGARTRMNVDTPFFGRLFRSITDRSPAFIEYRPGFFRAYEAEIAVQLGRDLPPAGAPYTAADIMAATRAVIPAIEIIGTCFEPWSDAGAANLTADNAAHGRWITGVPLTDFTCLDLHDEPITLSINGEVVATGTGLNVDGGPFGATAWLANTLAAMGRTLEAGDYVTTGSVTAPHPVGPGEQVVASFGPLGDVALTIS